MYPHEYAPEDEMNTRDNVLGVLDHPGVVNSALIAGGRRARPGVMGSVPVDDRSMPGEQQQQQQQNQYRGL